MNVTPKKDPVQLSTEEKERVAQSKTNALALRKKLNEEKRRAEKTQVPVQEKAQMSTQEKPKHRTLMDLQPTKKTVQIALSVHTENHFQVLVKPKVNSFMDTIRSLPQQARYWNDVKQAYMIRFASYYQLIKKFLEMKDFTVDIDELPLGVKKIFVDEAGKHADITNSILKGEHIEGLDDELVKRLFPYQRRGVAYGICKKGRVLIADEMGLGKSVQALSIALYYRSEWPLLIVCPASVRPSWRNQLLKFTDVTPSSIRLIEKKKDPLPADRNTSTVIIMSYDLMNEKKKELLKLGIYVIILDESHMLKDSKTARAKNAKELAKKANRVLLLSGTPALSRPAELFSQIEMINGTLFKSFHEFALRYCDGQKGRFGFESKGATNTVELTAILRKTIMIRRRKNEVLTDLPEKTRDVVYLSGDKIDQKIASLRKLKEEMDNLAAEEGVNSANTQEQIMRYYQMTAEVKADSVAEYIVNDNFYDTAEPRKILIFGHHMIVLDTISRLLDIKGVKYIRIDGKVSPRDREEMCNRFQERPDVMVAILGILAAGTGITLTAANKVIFAELNWNPTLMMQAEDRAHRIGQMNPVLVQYMLAKNTADDCMWPLMQKKLTVLGSVSLASDNYHDAQRHHHDLSNNLITSYFTGLAEKDDAENAKKISAENTLITDFLGGPAEKDNSKKEDSKKRTPEKSETSASDEETPQKKSKHD